jgi:hypothetical protein
MKGVVLACVCFAFVCVQPKAETVMVSLLNDSGVEYLSEERNPLASALVEGAMGVFFEANHIVFDLGLPEDDRPELPDRETAALIARTGGAAYMLDVRLGAPDGDEGLPEYLVYDFIDLVNNLVVVSGVINRDDLHTEVKDSLSLCVLMGEKAASEAVGTLE